MKLRTPAIILAAMTSASLLWAPQAVAFCGVIQETAQSQNPMLANPKATRMVDRKVRALKHQYRRKLVLDQRSSECVGGAVAIDANGNQIVGPARCTVTQPFCVNP
ncbi:MAG: hypothetical protein IPM06_01245 [Rhizobiales bacterium]|nr:hypothetical protein [Hyphomicrobiales bacterium]